MKVKSNEQGNCPFCNSDNLDYSALELEGDMCYFPYLCLNCSRQGEEWYSMQFEGHNILTENGSIEITQDMIESEE